jgi:hypothetical protein
MTYIVDEMLSDKVTREKLTRWAVAIALESSQQDRDAAMRACARVCAVLRQSITRAVIDEVERHARHQP